MRKEANTAAVNFSLAKWRLLHERLKKMLRDFSLADVAAASERWWGASIEELEVVCRSHNI